MNALTKQGRYIKKLIAFCIVLLVYSAAISQNAPVSNIGTVINAVPGTASVPVTVTSFTNICQFTLTIKFDTTKIHYVSATTNPLLSGMTVSYTSPSGNTQGTILMSWTSATNLSLTNGASLAGLNFTYLTATGLLSWAYTYGAVCQYKSYINTVLTTLNDNPKYQYYINGGISNRAAPLTYAPYFAAPAAGSIQIPITVNNFTTIGALTLYLEYDTTVISYQNSFTKNAAFNSSFLVGIASSTGSKKMIVIQWYGSSVTLSNGATLCTLNFTYLNSSNYSPLTWFDNGPSCEYADASGNVLIDMPAATYYINGTVGSGIKLNGQLLYDNATASPLNGATVKLVNSSNVVLATTTTANYIDNSVPGNPVTKGGYFEFTNLNNGNYSLRTSVTTAWGGVNATDALIVKQNTIGLLALSGLPLIAADVNKSNTINSTDALLIQLRSIGTISQFNLSDWIIGDTTVTVSGSTTHNVKALAAGDVNQSYVFSSKKTAVDNAFQKEGIIYAAIQQEIEIPLRLNEAVTLGAVSMEIKYPEKYMDISAIDAALKDFNYSIKDGLIKISWADLNAVKLQANDILFTLKAKLKAEINSNTAIFSYTSNTEFADENANIIMLPALKISSIETIKNNVINVYPNPVNASTVISIELAADGKLSLDLFDYTGRHIKTLVNEYQQKGRNNFTFDATVFPAGIYMATVKLNDEFLAGIKLIKK